MSDNIDTIVQNGLAEIKVAKSEQLLNVIEQKYLGKTGLLPRSLKSAAQLPASFLKVRLRSINTATNKLSRAIEKRREQLK